MASSSFSSFGPLMGLTHTQRQQKELEAKVSVLLQTLATGSVHHHSVLLELWREEHTMFLSRGLEHLGPSFSVLDANRPWLCYWILHSLALLGEPIDPDIQKRSIDFLSRCQDPGGGYGGGPGQLPHLATTYAAVFSLVTIGGADALASINRERTLDFILEMKDSSGGFRMHKNGEIDVRGCYTAIAVAHILDLMLPAVVSGVAEYIISCQTHEGGIGGEPGAEAHGGYTYCGLAALVLLNEAHRLDLRGLVSWAVFRQGKVEGGFQGRVNKLVDGCYSFWQGGVFPLIQRLPQNLFSKKYVINHTLKENYTNMVNFKDTEHCVVSNTNAITAEVLFPVIRTAEWKHAPSKFVDDFDANKDRVVSWTCFLENAQADPLFNTQALQGYLLLCCQVFEGGLRDKPGKARDYYHTCYCLSGLSTAQYSFSKRLGGLPLPCHVLGQFDNLLEPTHPLCNVVLKKYAEAQHFFSIKRNQL